MAEIFNFSSYLAIALDDSERYLDSNPEKKRLKNIRVYSFKQAIGADKPFPDPAKLDQNVDLQWTQS